MKIKVYNDGQIVVLPTKYGNYVFRSDFKEVILEGDQVDKQLLEFLNSCQELKYDILEGDSNSEVTEPIKYISKKSKKGG